MTVTIRRVRPGEYDVVADLTAQVYRGEGYGSDDYEPVLRDVAGRDRDAVVLVAVDEDQILGAVAIAVSGPWAERAEPDEAEIRMLAVDPGARGQGVGTSLVVACLERARAAGCLRMRLSTEPTMAAAHRIYDRLGFTRTPERDWYPAPDIPLLTYVLALEAS
ncbi:MAG: GNAT family N-acetyltransferase [Mycobacteriales bacterium]